MRVPIRTVAGNAEAAVTGPVGDGRTAVAVITAYAVDVVDTVVRAIVAVITAAVAPWRRPSGVQDLGNSASYGTIHKVDVTDTNQSSTGKSGAPLGSSFLEILKGFFK